MLIKICRCLKTICRAEKLLRFLTALRIAVFIGAFVYAASTSVSLIKQCLSE